MPFSYTLVTPEPCPYECIGNQPTHISIYIGTATTIFVLRTVCSNPQQVQNKEEHIKGPFIGAVTLQGLVMD